MNMLYSLVKKDLIVAKKYLPILFIFSIMAPIFLEIRINFIGGGFISFFMTTLFIQYILFNSISLQDDKFGVNTYLCATPYSRKALVKAKYIFIVFIFTISSSLYLATSFFSAAVPLPSLFTIGMTLLIIVIAFGVFLPIQYKFGYEKTKYISLFLVFFTPFILPNIMDQLLSTNINLSTTMNTIFIYLVGTIVWLLSMAISCNIYARKDLQ